MYNRYMRNDSGTYIRIPQEDHEQPPPPSAGKPPPQADRNSEPEIAGGKFTQVSDALTGFLRQLLDQFHLDHVDTGDLILLLLLFLLFREEADEELLIALGLLLIL